MKVVKNVKFLLQKTKISDANINDMVSGHEPYGNYGGSRAYTRRASIKSKI